MKKISNIFIRGIVIPLFSLILISSSALIIQQQTNSSVSEKQMENIETPRKGYEAILWYFETWHDPLPAVLDRETLDLIWEEIESLPSEEGGELMKTNYYSKWTLLGPYGQNIKGHSGSRYTGRVLDVEYDKGTDPMLAAASGGLWKFWYLFPYPISDSLKSLVVGSFSSAWYRPDTILVGTGEPGVRGGTGLYLTEDGGQSWTQIPLDGWTSGFYKIRYQQHAENRVYLAATSGFYRSDDNGFSFIRTLDGNVCDFSVVPQNEDLVYAAIWGDGLYFSNDGGMSFDRIGSADLPPDTALGRIAITAYSYYTVYAAYSNNIGQMEGVYRTNDAGMNWADISPSDNYMGKQGGYDNCIGVCKTDSNIVLAGGVAMKRTTDGGSTWDSISEIDMHADQHRIEWSQAGNIVWVGNDGGVTVSDDYGATWVTTNNVCPITQYNNVGVGISDPNVIWGGSQDNGISGTTDGGGYWMHTMGGDGGSVAVDPVNANVIYSVNGVYGGNWAFRRHRSTDYGQNWTYVDNGIDPTGHWYHTIRHDFGDPLTLYNNSGQHAYFSIDSGKTWDKLNPTPFSTNTTFSLSVERFDFGGSAVYVCLWHTDSANHSGNQLMVYDEGVWEERSNGFHQNVRIRFVRPHPRKIGWAYAVATGWQPGEKLYKTTDRGITWTNISGNLPYIPMGDVIPHPSNDSILYVGTEFGCYKTTDMGTTWMRWNNGMPKATIISEMQYIDSTTENGSYYIVASSYGRGMWARDIATDDPVSVDKKERYVPRSIQLSQNYPNPFNPETTIEFEIPHGSWVKLHIYDITGSLVETLVDENLKPGKHKTVFNARKYASGVYFYVLKTFKQTKVKKMVLLK